MSSLNASGQAQAPTTWWYNNGIPDSVFLQTDVFSFRCIGAAAYTGTYDTTIVDSIVHRSSRPDAANEVYFDSTSTFAERLLEVQNIQSSGQMEAFYINISASAPTYYGHNQWYTIDDIILVNFADSYPDSATIATFRATYDLDSVFYPLEDSLPTITGCSFTYGFRLNIPSNQTNNYQYIADVLQDMYEATPQVVCAVSPNVVNQRKLYYPDVEIPEPAMPQETYIYDMCGNGEPEDTYRDFQWYIHNDAFDEFDFVAGGCPPGGTPAPAGTPGADAKICECWDMGLDGTGVIVSIIATGDIYFGPNHSDLQQQPYPSYLSWDCTNPPCVPLVPNLPTGNGMRMGGIIGAEENNTFGIAGIAPKSYISHIKIGDNFISDISMAAALQQALLGNVDIIATEYVSPIYSNSIFIELRHHNDYGRKTHLQAPRGTNIISPAGHTEVNVTGTVVSQHPARYNYDETPGEPEVIGVIASNMYDQLEDGSLNICYTNYVPNVINYAYPANYGAQYDIAAPSASFFSTEQDAAVTRLQTSTSTQDGDGVAVVAGVVALLLDAKYHQTFMEMRDRLREGADEVGGYSYLPPFDKSNEFASGRINCETSANWWPLATSKIEGASNKVTIFCNPNYWLIGFENQTNLNTIGEIRDLNGSVINNFIIPKGSGKYNIDCSGLASGVYLVNLNDGNNKFVLKAIK